MKTLKKIQLLIILAFFASLHLTAQCRDQNVAELTRTLKSFIEPTLSIVLDRDNSSIGILGSVQRFSIPAEDVSGPARTWRYHISDIKSDDSNLWFNKERLEFVLDVRFEGEGSEIKGTCPGCLPRFRDRRAPDINWTGSRIVRLYFRPIAFEGNISLEVSEVEIFGEFDINGVFDSFFPRLVRNTKQRIRTDIKTKATDLFRSTAVKREIGNRTRPLLAALGLPKCLSYQYRNQWPTDKFL